MTPMGTSAGYYMQSMLRSVGMTQDDVVIVPFPGGAGDAKRGMELMEDAIVNGDVDVISIWEPTPEDALHRLGDNGIMLQDRSVYREAFNLHARATDLADPEKRRSIVAFVRAVADASEALKEDPAPYFPLITQYTTYSEEQIVASLEEMDFSVQIIPDMLDVLEIEEVWVAEAANREPRSREELAQLIDYSVLEEALAD
jgi:NitT/TauT family transport system substrate-binding protein